MFFHKAVVFADAHFGRGNDSPVAHQDTLDFIDWMIDRAKSWGAETCLFLGDFYHSRHAIGIESLDAARRGLEKLSSAGFKSVICLKGNHDLSRKHDRDTSSLNFAKHVSGVTVIDHPVTVDEVTFLPWLVGDEREPLKALKSRYVFGHLATLGALMNARKECTGGENAVDADVFRNQDQVFSGHFHQRQGLRNVTYIGNVFPFDFSDANDDQRGIMLLEWGKEPQFESWGDQPLYRTEKLSALLDDPSGLRSKMTVRAQVDITFAHSELHEVRDTFVKMFDLRKFELVSPKQSIDVIDEGAVEYHTIEQIVIDSLQSMDCGGDLSRDRLVRIFNSLSR